MMRPDPRSGALAGAVRVAFAGVVVASFGADLWLLGGPLSGRTPTVITALVAVALAGLGVAVRPRWVAACALVGSVGSVTATVAMRIDHLRFGALVELVVLPALLGVLLARDRPAHRVAAAAVVAVATAVPLRTTVGAVSLILALAVAIGLAGATGVVVYGRLLERERAVALRLARQEDRLDLARELHDLVGHHVTGIIVTAQSERLSLDGDDPLSVSLGEIEQAGAETMRSVRHLVGLLRSDAGPTPDRPAPGSGDGPAAIDAIAGDLRRSHPSVELRIDAQLRSRGLPPSIAPTVVGVVREAATNVRRHGDPAGVVTIVVDRSAGGVTVAVADRTVGTEGDPAAAGFGLVGIRERVEALGGSVTVEETDRTWRLAAVLPDGGVPR